MFERILIDSGFFFGIFDERDQHHESAKKIEAWLDLESRRRVVAWPILYETLSTKIVKRGHLTNLERFLVHPRTDLVDDSPYRDLVEKSVRENDDPRWTRYRMQPGASLVDTILRLMIECPRAGIHGIVTFDGALQNIGYAKNITVVSTKFAQEL